MSRGAFGRLNGAYPPPDAVRSQAHLLTPTAPHTKRPRQLLARPFLLHATIIQTPLTPILGLVLAKGCSVVAMVVSPLTLHFATSADRLPQPIKASRVLTSIALFAMGGNEYIHPDISCSCSLSPNQRIVISTEATPASSRAAQRRNPVLKPGSFPEIDIVS